MKLTLEINFKTALRWLLAVLLIWAAISKLANLQEFYSSLVAYRLPLPDFFLRTTAIFLPWLELLCGLMLLARVQLGAALAWAIVLFAIFAIATGQAWARGLNISCGCFNPSLIGLRPDGDAVKFLEAVWFAFFRALLFTAGAIYLFRQEMRPADETTVG